MASVAKLTAVSKPNVFVVPTMSLSIVLGTPTSGMPRLWNSWAIASVPSPPMTTSASSFSSWNISTHAIGVVPRAAGGLDRIGERIAAVGRAENGAADAQDAGDVARREQPRTGSARCRPSKLSSRPTTSQLQLAAGLDDGADDGVETGRVAAAGHDTNAANGR